MRTRQQLVRWAAAKVRVGRASWLALPLFGEEKTFSFPLDPPVECEALADMAGVAAWVSSWGGLSVSPGVEVYSEVRRWRSLGRQRLPVRVLVHGASALSGLAGESSSWRALRERASRLRAELGDGVNPALPTIASRLPDMEDADVSRMLAAVRWLMEHPDAGLFARQLPIVGVDTKWLERHRGVVTPVIRALTGGDELGLRIDPRRFRVRILDDAIAHPLRDFTASVTELAMQDLDARWVLICENLTSVRAMNPLQGVVAVHGLGDDVAELAAVGWIERARQCYWGDLDSHGFRILGLARKALPAIESIMMDIATLERFETMIIPEPKPYRGDIGYLTGPEQEALAWLRRADSRLEQERIDWTYAWQRICEYLA